MMYKLFYFIMGGRSQVMVEITSTEIFSEREK